MDNETILAPAVLSAEQTEQVAGGLALSPVAGGCPGCTSGRIYAFQNLAESIATAAKV
jgi:hypothetical protein